jgi:hypothetical protein
MSRKLLKVTNVILALITIVVAGASFISGIDSPIYGSEAIPPIPSLDSNLRFMGGLGLGLGFALLWITPTIDKQGALFKLIWICALLGGIGRLVSMAVIGSPPMPLVVFTLIEVPSVPLLIYWQNQIAKVSSADSKVE